MSDSEEEDRRLVEKLIRDQTSSDTDESGGESEILDLGNIIDIRKASEAAIRAAFTYNPDFVNKEGDPPGFDGTQYYGSPYDQAEAALLEAQKENEEVGELTPGTAIEEEEMEEVKEEEKVEEIPEVKEPKTFSYKGTLKNLENLIITPEKAIKDLPFGRMSEEFKLIDAATPEEYVRKKLMIPGNGEPVNTGDLVSIWIKVWIENVDTPVINRKEILNVGQGGIQLVAVALETMEIEETSLFIGTPAYGYGSIGLIMPDPEVPGIPPDVNIMAEIKILSLAKLSIIDIPNMSDREREEIPYFKYFKYALEQKNTGNLFYVEGKYEEARERYEECLEIIALRVNVPEEEINNLRTLRFTIFSNIGQTYLVEKNYEKCMEWVGDSFKLISPKFIPPRPLISKNHTRTAEALFAKGMSHEAFRSIQTALAFNPNNPDAMVLNKKVMDRIEFEFRREREMSARMISLQRFMRHEVEEELAREIAMSQELDPSNSPVSRPPTTASERLSSASSSSSWTTIEYYED